MNHTTLVTRDIAAPRATALLAEVLALGVLLEAAFAGGFIGGHHMWLSWHQNLGDVLLVLPLASVAIGIGARRRRREAASSLTTRIALLFFAIVAVAAGHEGGAMLAIHIPAAVVMVGIIVRQVTMCRDTRATT
ncbi:MAG: hypothetical protein HKL85_02995 [Acidimicrobiaceae bacterium]|nr:hypothetical protein [Acidimicrobiaceae bacterium]